MPSRYVIRPMTRTAMAIERMAVETGYPAIDIIRHVMQCPERAIRLKVCRQIMFGHWRFQDPETGKLTPDPEKHAKLWVAFRDSLFEDFDQEQGC